MATVSSIAPIAPDAPRPIRALNRKTGLVVELVPSQSEPNKYHVVSLTECDCRGFQARGRCSHLTQVQRERGVQKGGAADMAVRRAAGQWPAPIYSPEMAQTYRDIFGGQE